MLLSTIEELRLIYPNHAYDSIDGLVGFIDNSEHGFLEDKLGTPLYNALCDWYKTHRTNRNSVITEDTSYYNRLLLMSQRVIGFDALGRAAGMQVASGNNSGINVSVADDYPRADDKAIDTFRKTCFTEALKSCDQMLAELEKWVTESSDNENQNENENQNQNDAQPSAVSPQTSAVSAQPSAVNPQTSAVSAQPSESGSDAAANSSLFTLNSSLESERSEIVTLWQKSRYYYLAASMLIPSAVVLQQYLDFSESREKFIRMLPDLRFLQEEQIAPVVGEEWLDHLVDVSLSQAGDGSPITTKSPLELRIIHQLRRVMVAWLVSRTSVIKYDKEQKIQAHDDAVRKTQDTCNFIRQHQADLLDLYKDNEAVLAAYKASPLYVAVEPPQPSDNSPQPSPCGPQPPSGPALWTPPLR